MGVKSYSDILCPDCVAVGFPAADRREVIEKLVSLLPIESDKLRQEIHASVLRREEIQTTGIGHGIAIPHGKGAIEEEILTAVVTTADPVDYGSVDGNPVSIFILMVSRLNVTGPHIQALANVARLLGRRRFREDLLACTTPEAVASLVKTAELE
jgi:nitrogen PTS system EIIA component